jgi:hypothetical protein
MDTDEKEKKIYYLKWQGGAAAPPAKQQLCLTDL